MMAQGGETAGDKGPGRVSPPRSKLCEGQNRRSHAPQVTVFVVDDEEPVRETLVELLSIHGYRAITAASVGEAEEAKQRLGVAGIHLDIADIHLTPGRQIRVGYALAQRWCAQHPGFPVILISGDPSNQELPEVREGSLPFLLKPFRWRPSSKSFERLLAGKLLSQWLCATEAIPGFPTSGMPGIVRSRDRRDRLQCDGLRVNLNVGKGVAL